MRNLSKESKFQHKVESMTSLPNTTMKALNDFCDMDKPGRGYRQKWTNAEVMKLNK